MRGSVSTTAPSSDAAAPHETDPRSSSPQTTAANTSRDLGRDRALEGSVSDYLRRVEQAGVSWESALELSESELERLLFTTPGRNLPVERLPIDLHWVHRDLRKKSVTLQLLWIEYGEAARHDPAKRRPYQYSQFCERYRQFHRRIDLSMRQEHHAGERCFVDYSGARPSIVDRRTEEVIEVELFVAVLGAGNYSYAEATRTQQRDEFIGSVCRAFEYFGGVPEITAPDQLRSAVSGPNRIDAEINPVFAEFAEHYGTAVVPARPRKPKDKPRSRSVSSSSSDGSSPACAIARSFRSKR